MRVIKKHAKTIGKILFVLILILIIIYTFKDSAGDILTQLKKTSFLVIAGICIASVMYELVEGWISYSLAKVYHPDFKYWQGVECAFYAAFYRVATLGSGAGVAAIYYFNERGVPYSKVQDSIPLSICCTRSALHCLRESSLSSTGAICKSITVNMI